MTWAYFPGLSSDISDHEKTHFVLRVKGGLVLFLPPIVAEELRTEFFVWEFSLSWVRPAQFRA